MRGKRFTDEQITYALRQAEGGRRIAGGGCLPATEIRKHRQLRDENTRLKRLAAGLTLDKHILGEVVRKKL